MAMSERKRWFKMRMHEVVKGITIPSMNELINIYMSLLATEFRD
jgi:hypothetical protein